MHDENIEPCSCRWWLVSALFWFDQAEQMMRSATYWRERGDVDMVLQLTQDSERAAEQAAVCTHMAFLAAGTFDGIAVQRRAA